MISRRRNKKTAARRPPGRHEERLRAMSESNEKKIHISATNGSSSSDNGGRMAGEVFDLEVPGHVPDPQGNYKKGMNSRHVQVLPSPGALVVLTV